MKQLECQVANQDLSIIFSIICIALQTLQNQLFGKYRVHQHTDGSSQKPSIKFKVAIRKPRPQKTTTSWLFTPNALLLFAVPEVTWRPRECLVGAARFERATSCSQSRCATWLRHAPIVSAEIEQRWVTGKKKVISAGVSWRRMTLEQAQTASRAKRCAGVAPG